MGDPGYPFPVKILLNLSLSALTGRRRSFRSDARRMIAAMHPGPVIEGRENIPLVGPGVITVNHYARPGFWTPWFPAAVSAAVPLEIYWTMTDAFTYPGHPLSKVLRMLSHWALTRVAWTYGFNSMPPMPPVPEEAHLRAASIRRLLQYARANPQALLGLAPEGGDQPYGVLHLPPEGFGRLSLALAKRGMRFYPVGIYEAGGSLHVCFGEPYRLEVQDLGDPHAFDMLARRQVMQAIAACLPEAVRGEFVEKP